jgi:hypothetical protein
MPPLEERESSEAVTVATSDHHRCSESKTMTQRWPGTLTSRATSLAYRLPSPQVLKNEKFRLRLRAAMEGRSTVGEMAMKSELLASNTSAACWLHTGPMITSNLSTGLAHVLTEPQCSWRNAAFMVKDWSEMAGELNA